MVDGVWLGLTPRSDEGGNGEDDGGWDDVKGNDDEGLSGIILLLLGMKLGGPITDAFVVLGGALGIA